MSMTTEAFVEYQRPDLSGRTHKSSRGDREPPTGGRSSPEMRPASWSSHGHIRFRRDGIEDPSWRREQVLLRHLRTCLWSAMSSPADSMAIVKQFPAAKLQPQRPRAPWGVPDEALIQQKIGGWTARRCTTAHG
jgi:hypothetical protein